MATTDPTTVGIVEREHCTFAHAPNEMTLESGAKLGPITIAYETYGELNTDKTNAVLITHAVSGDAHVAGRHAEGDSKPGWWDDIVGPGKAFDTNIYFVICSNVLGGCQGSTGPSSINPDTQKPYGLDFPIITIGDMVRAQRELIRELDIDSLLSVAGGSMGGMQVLEWTIQFPHIVQSAMVIASTHLSGAQQIAFDAVGRHAIMADDNFNKGQYFDGAIPDKGLAIARMLAHITYLSDDGMHAKFGRRLQTQKNLSYEFENEFAVESYLNYQGEQFVSRFDADTYLYLTKAMDYFDISAKFGSLDAALAHVKNKVLVLSFSSDWLYPPYQSEQISYALARQGNDVSYCNIQSDYGHDAFLLEVDTMSKIISGYLAHAADPEGHIAESLEVLDSGPRKDKKKAAQEGEYRYDYELMRDLIEDNSRVLDIGCGEGALLCHLIAEKNVQGLGLEIDQDKVVKAIAHGIPVIHGDIDKGLNSLPDHSFDYVTFSRTLQIVKRPHLVLLEMLRVGKKCIVTFPNFAYWQARAMIFLQGRSPITSNLPFAWYKSPNRHYFSIIDFRRLCDEFGITIEQEIPLTANGPVKIWPNLLAEDALYVISSNTDTLKGISQS